MFNSAAAAEVLVDGGFEATVGTTNLHWENEDTEYPDGDLCITGNYCGGGDVNIQPRTGVGWLWFGGSDVPGHSAYVRQSLVIPPNQATLTFYAQFGYVEEPATATVTVTVDGIAVLTLVEPSVLQTEYQKYVVDVSAFATGGQHVLQFAYLNPSESYQDVSIDDVSLVTSDTIAPDTGFTSVPAGGVAKSLKVPLAFASTEPGSTYLCSVDGSAFAACSNPSTFTVTAGRHTVRVAARDTSGNTDASPATVTFKAYDCASLKTAVTKAKKKVKKLKAALRAAKLAYEPCR